MTFDLLTAVSLNGALAAGPGRVSTELPATLGTPLAVHQWVNALRRRYDAVAVGTGTVLIDDPTLTSHVVAGGPPPVRVTLDRSGRIPRHARIFDGSARTLVGVVASTPPDYLDFLAARGVEAVTAGDDRIDLAAFAAALADRGLPRVVVEGGGRLNRELLRLGLVDRIHLTLLPAVLDATAVNLFAGPGEPVRLTLLSCDRLDDYLFLVYQALR